MDGATGTSKTAAHGEGSPGTVTGVVADTRNPRVAGVQTLNGTQQPVVTSCHTTADGGGDSSQSAVKLVNNGPVPASKAPSPACSTITSTGDGSLVNAATSPQPSAQSVPTVTLVRPPVQTLTGNKSDSAKAVTQTGNGQVAASGTALTTRSPTVLQNLRTSVPSTLAATPAGIRAIAPPVLAPRITQPHQNIQNIQLPPGNELQMQAETCTFVHLFRCMLLCYYAGLQSCC